MVIRKYYILSFVVLIITLLASTSCEDTITPELEPAPPLLVVDAWITNKPEPQVIHLSQSQNYFDNTPPLPVSGAEIGLLDNEGVAFVFEERTPGEYVWSSPDGNPFGKIGNSYTLGIRIGEKTYTSFSTLNRVPPIDSVTFRFEEEDFPFPDSYFAEFWARDPQGTGDTYWIKAYKNGEFLNNPDEISIAYDAGFSEGGNVDGLIFIQPIRDSVNPFEEDDDGEFLSPYNIGDSLFVELHSISNEAFFFLNQVRLQTDRPGGFAELFATPLSNVVTNIVPSDSEEQVLGFFNVAAVESKGSRLVE